MPNLNEPKIPSYSVGSVITLRDKLYESAHHYAGTTPIGEDFVRFCRSFSGSINHIGIKGTIAVDQSLAHLVSRELTAEMIYNASWRIAGNVKQIKDGRPVQPWTQASQPSWCPIQFMEMKRKEGDKDDVVWMETLVLAGPACPSRFMKRLTIKACSYVASKSGFGPVWTQSAYRHPLDLVSMRMVALVSNDKYGTTFTELRCPDSMKGWNKKTLSHRARISLPCQFEFTHACRQCPVGYDRCQAAVHPNTREFKICMKCGDEYWHEPSGSICIRCAGLI